jgi:hypothetical protein
MDEFMQSNRELSGLAVTPRPIVKLEIGTD